MYYPCLAQSENVVLKKYKSGSASQEHYFSPKLLKMSKEL